MKKGIKRRTPDSPCYVCGCTLRYVSASECINCKKRRAAQKYNERIEGQARDRVLFYFTSGVHIVDIALKLRRSAYRIKECLIECGLMKAKLLNERVCKR